MGYSRLSWVMIVILVVLFSHFLWFNRGIASEGIDPLQLEGEEESWQITLGVSRSTANFRRLSFESSGLWEERNHSEDTSFSLSSSFDINETIAIRGRLSWVVKVDDLSKTNLWTGAFATSNELVDEFAEGKLVIKYVVWQNPELKTYVLLPILDEEMTLGLTWSQDPIMVFPRISLSKGRMTFGTALSFVANSSFAFTGKASLSQGDNYSILGFGGGIVYSNNKQDGLKLSVSLRKGKITSLSLGVGLTYGEQTS